MNNYITYNFLKPFLIHFKSEGIDIACSEETAKTENPIEHYETQCAQRCASVKRRG